MCFGVHTLRAGRSRSLLGSRAGGPRHANPSNSRHLLEFGQALLRRGKQMFDAERMARAPGPRVELKMPVTPAQAPCPSAVAGALPQWPDLRPPLQTTVYGRLIDL